MSEAEAEAVISEDKKQMELRRRVEYLKTEYHFNGANYVCMRTFHEYQGSRRKSIGISEKILRNIHSPIGSEENLQILQACMAFLQQFCWRFYFPRIWGKYL